MCAAILSASAESLPTAAIFLDMDGVLIAGRQGDKHAQIRQKLAELFKKKEDLNGAYTELEWRIAASHFLDKEAVSQLDKLIEKVSKVAKVVIVISSDWREDGTVQEIKEKMFGMWSFSKFIIDKTPDDNDERFLPIAQKKYGLKLKNREDQIDFWLRENAEKMNIRSFVMIDDCPLEKFPKNFIKTHHASISGSAYAADILQESDIPRAYEILTNFKLYKPW